MKQAQQLQLRNAILANVDGWMDSLIYFIRGPATTTQASLRDRAYSRGGVERESGRQIERTEYVASLNLI